MKLIFLILSIIFSLNLFAENRKIKFSTYYYQRKSLFENLSVDSNDILFIGNSITDGGEWAEFFKNPNVKNRGINGDTTDGLLDRLPVLLKGKPDKIFLMIGINNVQHGHSIDYIITGINAIIEMIKRDSPRTQLFIQSILPVTPFYKKFQDHTSRWEMIPKINEQIKSLAVKHNIKYIDLYSHFADEKGQMKLEYTNDGLHLLGKGYMLWIDLLKNYMY